MEGKALTTFNAAVGTTESDEAYQQGLNAVRDTVFPARAVLTQKRYMRRFLRKPAGTKTAEFVTLLAQNQCLFEQVSTNRRSGGERITRR